MLKTNAELKEILKERLNRRLHKLWFGDNNSYALLTHSLPLIALGTTRLVFKTIKSESTDLKASEGTQKITYVTC